jgi:antitoxin (DNA-binding transcriptional repressor) of toxin-antitoxin stability system
MPEVTATDAARNFADLLDAIEHRGEHFTIVRRGKAVASLEPTSQGRGSDVKAALMRHRPCADPRSSASECRANAPHRSRVLLPTWRLIAARR